MNADFYSLNPLTQIVVTLCVAYVVVTLLRIM